MHKCLLGLLCFGLIQAPAISATKPTDMVNVLNMHVTPPPVEETEKVYAKPWSAIKLEAKTRAKINALQTKLDSGGGEQFKLLWIRIVNDEVQTVMFQGNRSTTWIYNMTAYEGMKNCYVTVIGSGPLGGCE
ncbi:MAG TPA: hypothetical protein V6D23_16475 [Candidatus Obscuribacterales bacterium]